MATKSELDYRVKAAGGPLAGILSGLNKGFETENKNMFKRSEKMDDRRFQIAKMMASDMLARERQESQNMFERMTKDRDADRTLSEDFPDQWSPIRSVSPADSSNNFMSREELEKVNKVYEAIKNERSRRLKVKESGFGWPT